MALPKWIREGVTVALCVMLGATVLAVPAAAAPAADANPIVVENSLPGTDTWRIGQSGFRVADDVSKQIKGYASATSVNVGQSIDLKVSVSPAQSFGIKVFRVGWYGGLGGRLVATVGPLAGVTQSGCPTDPSTGLIECQWSTSYTLTVPSDWTSGVYLAQLTNDAGFQNYIQFVVRDDARPADLLYQLPVANYQAYNNFPSDGSTNCGTTVPKTGKNLYDNQSAPGNTVVGRPRAVKVSFDRPYACGGADEIFGADWSWDGYFIHWLERSGYDVSYSTSLDTHQHGARLLDHKGFISVGHDEYWSSTMFDAAEAARDAGVNLAFFGGNDVYWQVRFEPSSTGVPDRVMVAYKNTPNNSYSTLDPYPDPKFRTVRFRDPPVNRPEQNLLGVTFWSSTERSTLNTPYVVQDSDHWMYAGTGFEDGSGVPGIVGYEADAYSCQYGLPPNTSYDVLSSSPMRDGDGFTQNMNAVLYHATSGAWVFAAGTMSWSWALDDKIDPADPNRQRNLHDPRMERATANLLDVFVGKASATDDGGVPPPCTYDKQMTFEGGALTGQSGANRTVGAVGVETAAPLHGTYSASIRNAAAAWIEDLVTPADDLTVSATFVLRSKPSVDVRLLVVSNMVPDVGNLVLRANADGTTRVQLRNANTRIGVDSPPLTVGTRYRVQLHQKRGAGADGVLEGFVTPADTPFGAPFAQTVGGTFTTKADRVRIGSTTNSATTPPLLDAVIDDVTIRGAPAAISATPPYPPSNLTATAVSAGQVNLAWTDTATDEGGFTIQRSVNAVDWTTLTTTLPPNTTTYSDSTTTGLTTYQYRAKATNANGDSAWSDTATVTTPGVPPGTPTGLTATQAGPSRIDLAWTDNAADETGFVVERASDSTFTAATSVALPADTTSWSDTGLTDGVHWYRLRAVNDAAWSAWAGPVRGSRIKDMTFEAGSLTGALGATKVASTTTVNLDTSAPIKGAASARFPMGTQAAYLEETFPATNELFTSFYFRPGSRGTADVRIAQTVHGTGSTAVTAGSLLLRAGGAIQLRNYNTTIGTGPTLAVGVTYRLGIHQHMLDNGLLQLDGYVAQGDAPFGAPFASTTTATIATTIGAGSFRVGATGSTGGLDATIDDVKLDTRLLPPASGADQAVPPPAPSGLSATALSSSEIRLTWTDTAADETSFAVQRSTDGSSWTVVAATLAANTTTFTDTGLTGATSYQYRVSATNANGTSPWSTVASASTAGAPPSAPTGLAARQVSLTQIDLTWTDTSTDETGFVLERASDSTFGDATPISIPADATAYSDVGLTEGMHWYRLKAVAGPSASGWSNAVRGSRIKDMTFDAGSLTGPAGATKVATTTTVGLETGTPLKGAYSARIPMGTAAAYLEESFSPENELFVSFYLRPGQRGTADVRLTQTLHGTGGTAVTAGSLLLKASGQIQLRNNNTVIGSGAILQPGVVYRLGLHQKMLANGLLQLDGYLVEGDAAFGGPFASTTTATISTTTGAGMFRVGATGTAGGLDATIDSIALDSAAMPSATAGAALAKPPAPTGLTAMAISPSEVDLSWTDQAANEDSFTVERSTTTGGSWTVIATLPPDSTIYTDTTAESATTYLYRVSAANASGSEGPSAAASATTPGYPPTAPAGLRTGTSPEQVDLAWTDTTTDQTSVTVERSTDGETWSDIATLAGDATTFSDVSVHAATGYTYRLRSANANGVSPYSDTASVTTPAAAPAAPTRLVAVAASPGEIDLEWVDQSAGETAFVIERSTDATTWTVIQPALEPDSTSYADTDVLEGTTYWYRVGSTAASGTSWSGVASASTPWSPPADPAVLGATAVSPTRIDLNWSDAARNETGFILERDKDVDFGAPTVIDVPANTTSYSDTTVAERTTYHYRVKARNAAGDSGWSNVASATTPGAPPSAPSGLVASASSSSEIDLAWTDTSATETVFIVERSPDGTTWTTLADALAANTTSYRDTGLAEGTAYRYRVSATNEFGRSTSEVATATTLTDPPAAPTGIAVTAVSPTRIAVIWTDAATNETGFTLERSTSSTFASRSAVSLPAGTTGYSDTGVTEGTTYYYRIRATNGGGASDWVFSGAVSTPLSLPAAPQSVTATAVDATTIDLAWIDAATNESGYTVDRSTNGTDWTQVATPPAGSTGYRDSSLVERTTYQYRVRAVNSAGTSSWSNTASATTPATPPNAPTGLTATQVSLTRIDLSWTDTSANETGFVLERSGDGVSWTAIGGSLAANTTTYSDTGLADGVHWYRVKATRFGVSSPSSPLARGSRVKDMTFEAGTLTGPFGGTTAVGTPGIAVTTTSPIRGTTSARILLGTAPAYLEEPLTSANEVFVSFYVRVTTRGGADVQLLQVLHGTGASAITSGNIVMHGNGKLDLRNNTTVIGAGTAGLKTGTVYRIGLHEKMLAGGRLQIDAYLADASGAFGTPFASTTTATIGTTAGAGAVRVGATSGGGLDATIDEVSVDLAFLPPSR